MANGRLNRDCVSEAVDECVERSPEVAGFRELLEMACRHATAQAVVTEQPPNVRDVTADSESRVDGAGTSAENDTGVSIPASASAKPAVQPSVIVGEVMETQHPLRPGRVLVRWQDPEHQTVTEWLLPERHLSLRAGDRVVLALPSGWTEWIVTGALGPDPMMPQSPPEHAREVKLEPGEVVRFVAHDGRPLVTVRQSSEGPLVELGEGNVELKAGQTLTLSGQTVEIHARSGIDVRTDGDTVVRGRTIRLN